jgi:Ulp1 family protease
MSRPKCRTIWAHARKQCRDGNRYEVVHRTGALKGQFRNMSASWETIALLAPGSMADDTVINVWFRELVRWFIEGVYPLDTDMFVFDSQFYQTGRSGCLCYGTPTATIIASQTRKTADTRGVLGVLGFDYIVVPMNVNSGTHWAVGIVDMKRNRFELYDSMLASHDPDYCEEFAARISVFLTEYAELKGLPVLHEYHTWARFTNTGLHGEPMPQQNDGASCGYYILMAVEQRIMGRELEDVSEKLRRRITRHLTSRLF